MRLGPGRSRVLKELTNYELVPHFIGELSANSSPTFIAINMANFEAFCISTVLYYIHFILSLWPKYIPLYIPILCIIT